MEPESSGTLNLDTHIVLELLKGDLSQPEEELILRHRLAISDIVIWEIAKLIQLDRLLMDLESREFEAFYRTLSVLPISLDVAIQSTRLDFDSDPADEIIAATSIVHEIPLLTRDRRILTSNLVPFPSPAT